jgi:hypothetical protein
VPKEIPVNWSLASLIIAAFVFLQQASPPAPTPTLDYDVFKSQVQPILLAKRAGHARCVTCHSTGTSFRLQPLSPGSAAWTDEQSRKNFDAVRRVAAAGNAKSRILVHPLAESAGGDFFHNGGKHWQSQDDPEWQVLKAWILGPSKKPGS